MTPEDFSVWHPGLNASIPWSIWGVRCLWFLMVNHSWLHSHVHRASVEVVSFTYAVSLWHRQAVSSNVLSFQTNLGERIANAFIKGTYYEALILILSTGKGLDFHLVAVHLLIQYKTLLLADGAMAQENLPLFPLLQPSRNVDVIIALDATVNGHALITPTSMVDRHADDADDFTGDEIDGFFKNSFLIATQKNSTLNDPEWPECLACAIIDKQQKRSNLSRTPQCVRCFKKYCG
ncbi:hypothetical protein H4Q26_004021 [Puccinia striiformis f. sp. tritici PST-130]|nr:hypothetical protein H4Q26_004021 [Puccinia striiformis f. sp. tritici PST-130]